MKLLFLGLMLLSLVACDDKCLKDASEKGTVLAEETLTREICGRGCQTHVFQALRVKRDDETVCVLSKWGMGLKPNDRVRGPL